MLMEFSDPDLAEAALYEYPKGGTTINDLSIRAAETIARHWGNMEYGISTLDQSISESMMQAFAWDMETNTRSVINFTAAHETKAGGRMKYLDDPRDIYEHTANLGSRRKRACILALIPAHIKVRATERIEETIKTKVQITPEYLAKTLAAWGSVGVSQQMIEKKIGRPWSSLTPVLAVHLFRMFNSIKDGVGKVADFFETPEPASNGNGGSRTDALKTKMGVDPKPAQESKPAPTSDPAATKTAQPRERDEDMLL
jgi:hypothetical protein